MLRQVVLPVLRLLVWIVIAVALCVLAFGRAGGDGDDDVAGATPTGEVTEPVVPAVLGDVKSTVELSGTVSADPATPVKAGTAGRVGRILVPVGGPVAAETPVAEILVPVEPVDQPRGLVEGAGARAAPERSVLLLAGTAGTVASIAVLTDEQVSVGDDVASISPGTLSVTAPLTQAQQFRLLTPPPQAAAQAPGGPAPFSCTDLRADAVAPASDEGGPDGGSGPTTAQVRCRVPGGTTVFAGMRVDLTLDLGTASGVLVVPVTAVLGTTGEGRVWVVGPDGDPATAEERPVRLGLTDGAVVQVVEGLAEGEQVLEFTPVPSDDEGQQGGAPPDGAVL